MQILHDGSDKIGVRLEMSLGRFFFYFLLPLLSARASARCIYRGRVPSRITSHIGSYHVLSDWDSFVRLRVKISS